MERSEAANALVAASEQFSALLRGVDDPSRAAVGSWNIAETAAHVAFVMQHLPEYLGGTEVLPGANQDFERLADAHTAYNDQALRSEPERQLATLATNAQAGSQRLIETAAALASDKPRPWFGGVDVPPSFYLAVAINEFLIHGFDIARATRRRWRVEWETAALVVEGFLPMTPHYVDHDAADGFSARYELRIRGGMKAYLTFRDGALSISKDRQGPVDCHISADPWSYLLVGYRRVRQWNAALRGRIVTWGRRPRLGLKFGQLVATP